jgi:hypothetical protein
VIHFRALQLVFGADSDRQSQQRLQRIGSSQKSSVLRSKLPGADGRIRTDAHDPLAPLILTTLTQGPALPLPLLAAIAIIGTGREGLAFVVLSLRSTRRRCPSFVLILALRVYAERRAELNER